MALWQYIGLVKPLEPSLTVAPPEISWWSPASEPVRVHEPLVAEGVYARPLEFSYLTPPDFDSWYRQTSEPVRVRPVLVHEVRWAGILEQTFFADPPELSWFAETARPVFDVAPLRPAPWDVLPLEPRIYIFAPELSWFRPASEPVRQKPQLVREGLTVLTFEPFAVGIVPPLAAWTQPQSEPRFVRAPLTPAPSLVAPTKIEPPEVPEPQSEPVRTAPPVLSGLFAAIEPPDVLLIHTLDQWSPHVEPVPARTPPRPAGGLYEPPPFNAMPVYGWLYPQSEPVREVEPVTPGAFVLVTFTEPVTDVPTSQVSSLPTWPMDRAPVTPGLFAFVHVPDPVQVDKWYRPLDEPTLPAEPLTFGGLFAPPVEVGHPTDWFQPQSAPRWLRPEIVRGGAVLVDFGKTAADDWQQPAQLPTPRLPGALPLGISVAVTEASLLVTPGLDSWYQPVSLPVRRPVTLTVGSPVVVFERTGGPTFGFAQRAQVLG